MPSNVLVVVVGTMIVAREVAVVVVVVGTVTVPWATVDVVVVVVVAGTVRVDVTVLVVVVWPQNGKQLGNVRFGVGALAAMAMVGWATSCMPKAPAMTVTAETPAEIASRRRFPKRLDSRMVCFAPVT